MKMWVWCLPVFLPMGSSTVGDLMTISNWYRNNQADLSTSQLAEQFHVVSRLSCIIHCATKTYPICAYERSDKRCYSYLDSGSFTGLTRNPGLDYYELVLDTGDWVDLRGFGVASQILIETRELSWALAETRCSSMGGHLYSMSTSTRKQALKDAFTSKGLQLVEGYWLGASDEAIEGDWEWIDGSVVHMGSEFWLPSQPNNANNKQHCAMLKSFTDFLLNDKNCGKSERFICEKPA